MALQAFHTSSRFSKCRRHVKNCQPFKKFSKFKKLLPYVIQHIKRGDFVGEVNFEFFIWCIKRVFFFSQLWNETSSKLIKAFRFCNCKKFENSYCFLYYFLNVFTYIWERSQPQSPHLQSPLFQCAESHICDTIKGNESYVGSIQIWFFNINHFPISNATFWSKPQ